MYVEEILFNHGDELQYVVNTVAYLYMFFIDVCFAYRMAFTHLIVHEYLFCKRLIVFFNRLIISHALAYRQAGINRFALLIILMSEKSCDGKNKIQANDQA